jgi:Uma2 family endonuclease
MAIKTKATVEDLYHITEDGKAEIVDGEIVRIMPTGGIPGRASLKIAFSLHSHELVSNGGYAIGTNVGFIVNLPNRNSFSPDAAWYVGDVESMQFLRGAPALAAEVRSSDGYSARAETARGEKRRDYFAAGTLVIWDVDLLSDDVVRVYRSSNPDVPTIYRRGDIAEAEPAVPGWTMPIDDLFK